MRWTGAIVAVALLGGCSPSADLKSVDGEVATFHASLNARDFGRIYREASPGFRAASTEAKFTKLLDAINRKLGAAGKATQQGWQDNVGTGGHIVTLTYATDYARGHAAERFAYEVKDGKARLMRYDINSPELITN